MSSSLLGLKNLRTLELTSGKLTGTPIPEFIGGLKNLRYLSLSSALFGGRVMPQLGNLSKLIHLDLNSLSRDIYSADLAWLSRLTTLQYLDLSRVNLSKVIDWAHAHVVNKLPSLVTLRLAACGLRNAIPSPLQSNLTSLEELDLYGNEFSTSSIGTKNLFWDLPSLLHLDMSGCGLPRFNSSKCG
jgi:Leucine-rich repeat (LRR) protein